MTSDARWIEVGDKVLRVQASGAAGPSLLLIHEMGGCLESWARLVPLLDPHCRILRYDVRGNGLSEGVHGKLDFPTVVEEAMGVAQALGAGGDVIPVGCAVGGAIALGVAAQFPEACSAVIALAPSTSIPPERRAAALGRADALETEGVRPGIDESLLRGYPPALRKDNARYEQVRAQRIAANPFGVAATLRMLADLDMTSAFASLSCPALIMAGEHDQDRPPAHVATVAAAIPGAEFATLPSGHFMASQTPELVAAKILSFLASKGLAAAPALRSA
jgi:3-oxoadipate enol-lactonase